MGGIDVTLSFAPLTTINIAFSEKFVSFSLFRSLTVDVFFP